MLGTSENRIKADGPDKTASTVIDSVSELECQVCLDRAHNLIIIISHTSHRRHSEQHLNHYHLRRRWGPAVRRNHLR